MGRCGVGPKLIGTAAAVFDPRVEVAVLARYGVDPQTVTLRRLRVLLLGMPPGYWPDDQSEASWSAEAHLLAAVVDAVQQTTWVVAAANSKRPPKRPKPLRRPGARRSGMSLTDMGRMIAGDGDG